MEPTNDPNHPANRYPWNRKGTAIRNALEQFLFIIGRAPGADEKGRKDALQWASEQMDKKPRELFP